MKKPLIKAWRINNKIEILNHTEEDFLKNKATNKGNNTKVKLADFHNTTIDWLSVINIDAYITHKSLLINAFKHSIKIISSFRSSLK